MTSCPSNGKHVRSHSLKSFPAVTATAIIDGKKSDVDGVRSETSDTLQTINPASKMTSSWKQVGPLIKKKMLFGRRTHKTQ